MPLRVARVATLEEKPRAGRQAPPRLKPLPAGCAPTSVALRASQPPKKERRAKEATKQGSRIKVSLSTNCNSSGGCHERNKSKPQNHSTKNNCARYSSNHLLLDFVDFRICFH